MSAADEYQRAAGLIEDLANADFLPFFISDDEDALNFAASLRAVAAGTDNLLRHADALEALVYPRTVGRGPKAALEALRESRPS